MNISFMSIQSSVLPRPSAVLRVFGPDSNTFLQGQFSNDLAAPPPAVRYGLWLDHRGKVHADSLVLRLAEKEFLAVSYFTDAEVLRAHLERSLVADEVEIADETERWRLVPMAGASLRLLHLRPPAESAWVSDQEAYLFAGRRGAGRDIELLLPQSLNGAWSGRLRDAGIEVPGMDDLERERILAGIPAVPMDVGTGDLPAEGGLDRVAISYAKGCFLGQEVMARLKNLGQVRRSLCVVHGAGDAPAAQAPLFQAEKRVGEMRSSTRTDGGFVGFAMLSLVTFDPAAGLALDPEGPVVIWKRSP